MNLGNAGGGVLTQFLGFGLISTAHRVTQLHKGRSFTNYAFDCVLMRGKEDEQGREMLDMSWIDARRDPKGTDAETAAMAPQSWRKWVTQGGFIA